jgi:hypothetical protein
MRDITSQSIRNDPRIRAGSQSNYWFLRASAPETISRISVVIAV